MDPMAPLNGSQTAMVRNYLDAKGREPRSDFTYRDLAMFYRVRGRLIAKDLPGIGKKERWLDRRSDDY